MTNYGPKVEWNLLEKGVRIYYTGDVANHDGRGTITKRWHDEKWGYRLVDIAMDDGRKIRAIHLESFQPGPGRRFWLAEDHEAMRQKRISEMVAEMKRRA